MDIDEQVELPCGNDCEKDWTSVSGGMYGCDQGAFGDAFHQHRHIGGEPSAAGTG